MIHRDRNEAPPDLVSLHTEWISKLELDNTLDSSKEWNRVRSLSGIKNARKKLVEMYDGKCCYCEHKSTSHPIEHYVPHSKEDPTKLLDYANLHLVCTLCNTHKSHRATNDIIDPSNEEPKDHISFDCENAIEITARGKSTIQKVGLNDPSLNTLRQEELRKVEREVREIFDFLKKSENSIAPVSIDTIHYFKNRIKSLKEDNLSLSGQFSRMFEVNFKKELDKIELVLDSICK